jgi:hypothetical protein
MHFNIFHQILRYFSVLPSTSEVQKSARYLLMHYQYRLISSLKYLRGQIIRYNFEALVLVRGRGVRVPVPQRSVPKEREPIFKFTFIDVFEMIESPHTRLLSFRGNLFRVPMSPEPTVEFAFLGMGTLV